MWAVSALSILFPLVISPGAYALTFVPASTGAVIASPSYGHASNGSLAQTPIVPGLVFDRFIQIFLENTDFTTAIKSTTMKALANEGILLTNYHAVTHPSEPNYIAVSGGDFFGLADDNFHAIPSSVSTIVDLLEQKNISWATYQESMLNDGDPDFSEAIPDYTTGSSTLHVFYERKHNPFIIYDSIATVPARAALVRNFNDFAVDFNASVLPQYIFVTPNLDDDGHDTNQAWIDSWLAFWFIPLLQDPRFNSTRTLITLTYDEGVRSHENNRVFNVLLGGAVPNALRGTTDNTFYTHFSLLSTVERNWQLNCLGRQDTNTTMANVFQFVAQATGFTNVDVTNLPDLSLSGNEPGPLNPTNPTTTFPAPNANAVCPGGGTVIP